LARFGGLMADVHVVSSFFLSVHLMWLAGQKLVRACRVLIAELHWSGALRCAQGYQPERGIEGMQGEYWMGMGRNAESLDRSTLDVEGIARGNSILGWFRANQAEASGRG
jgi:hypothetical protein